MLPTPLLQLLARAEDLSSFVRRGTADGWVEVTLSSGADVRPTVVKRKIYQANNNSDWWLNGARPAREGAARGGGGQQRVAPSPRPAPVRASGRCFPRRRQPSAPPPAALRPPHPPALPLPAYFPTAGERSTMSAVQRTVGRLNVQLDNLCQFLPQDRVVEFARLKPVELLAATEKAIGDASLHAQHAALVEHRAGLADKDAVRAAAGRAAAAAAGHAVWGVRGAGLGCALLLVWAWLCWHLSALALPA